MQQHIHTIVKHFFQKDSLQEVSEQTLRQFTEEHPYSSVGQWLLAKKVHDTAPDRAGGQSAQAVAWFNNPLWLHWTLQEHEPVAETLFLPSQKEETVTYRYTDKPETPSGETAAPAQPPVADESTDTDETEILIPGVDSPVSLVEEPAVTDPLTGIAAETESITEDDTPGPSATGEPAAGDTTAPAGAAAVEPQATPAPAAVATQTTETVQDIPAAGPDAPPPGAPLPGIAGLMEAFKPATADTDEPVFEPYHTIDYFASLGVKLRQEDLKDKLGIQLKSFTEWLRGMKKLNPSAMPEEVTQQFDEQLAQAIQEIAGHSVEGKEVVTEAMAEVWVKQGSKQKAIAIYEKLSLQNPAKSPYFAARIEQIKAL